MKTLLTASSAVDLMVSAKKQDWRVRRLLVEMLATGPVFNVEWA